MIEYDLLSRSVFNRNKYTEIRDERIRLKGIKDPREYPRKIVLNSTFGAQKDKYNALYDPRKANEICIYGQLFLLDLVEKLEGTGKLIQSNTDGVIFQLQHKSEYDGFVKICEEWSKRTKMGLEYEVAKRIIQKDVNNYILVMDDGKVKSKGGFVKKLNRLDNQLPIVNHALREYFVNGTPVEQIIMASDNLIDFQFITKVTGKYDNAMHNNQILTNKVYRVFASKNPSDGTLYKKHKSKTTYDKTAGTPVNCRIWNESVNGVKCPDWLDKKWYVNLAKERIGKFLGE
jgi:DNA polymerase elongation subunit (family B)